MSMEHGTGGEEADFGPESHYAIYFGDNSYIASRKLLILMKMM